MLTDKTERSDRRYKLRPSWKADQRSAARSRTSANRLAEGRVLDCGKRRPDQVQLHWTATVVPDFGPKPRFTSPRKTGKYEPDVTTTSPSSVYMKL